MASSWCSSSSLAHCLCSTKAEDPRLSVTVYLPWPPPGSTDDGTPALNRYGPPEATWPWTRGIRLDSGDSKVHGVHRRIVAADPETAGNVRRTPRCYLME